MTAELLTSEPQVPAAGLDEHAVKHQCCAPHVLAVVDVILNGPDTGHPNMVNNKQPVVGGLDEGCE